MTATSTQLVQQDNHGLTAGEIDREVHGSQYLTFMLAGEYYGVDILRVQEIKGWTQVTQIPNTPDYIQGVLNLRGTIVPIIDMRMRFSLEHEDYTPITVVIVLSVKCSSGDRVIGIVVDAVSDVLDVKTDDIKPSPDFGTTVNTEFISGLTVVGEQIATLLDVDKMLSMDELASIEGLSETA